MAAGKASDFKIYQEEFYSGMAESVVQNTQVFNAASNGSIRLIAEVLRGDYEKNAFFKDIANMITRRDVTSIAAATDLPMTQGEFVGVKVHRKIGPLAQTLDAWRRIGKDSSEMSFQLGKMIGERQLLDYVNTTLIAVEAAIQGQAALVTSFAATIDHSKMVDALAKMGDQAGRVVCWVMHSKPYYDLVKQSIADKIFGVANVSVYSGTAATLGRPTIVIDSPPLTDAGSPATYNTLGLTADAVTLKESEQREIVSEVVTGLENLVMRVQGEYAFNLSVKGFAWDITNGGATPTDAAIGTTTNWDKAVTQDKDLAGVRLVTQ